MMLQVKKIMALVSFEKRPIIVERCGVGHVFLFGSVKLSTDSLKCGEHANEVIRATMVSVLEPNLANGIGVHQSALDGLIR